ncbi:MULTISPECIES: hypothetical protein [Streptomyces]|uniref:hypothetical protein n=1 Tax=Streptomyces flaveolus TaxID=67297 RepID=UPI0019001205
MSNRRCGRWRDHRQVIDGILHRVRTGGVPWHDQPERSIGGGRWTAPGNACFSTCEPWPMRQAGQSSTTCDSTWSATSAAPTPSWS